MFLSKIRKFPKTLQIAAYSLFFPLRGIGQGPRRLCEPLQEHEYDWPVQACFDRSKIWCRADEPIEASGVGPFDYNLFFFMIRTFTKAFCIIKQPQRHFLPKIQKSLDILISLFIFPSRGGLIWFTLHGVTSTNFVYATRATRLTFVKFSPQGISIHCRWPARHPETPCSCAQHLEGDRFLFWTR